VNQAAAAAAHQSTLVGGVSFCGQSATVIATPYVNNAYAMSAGAAVGVNPEV